MKRLLLAAFLLQGSLFAALPPYGQSVRELQSLVTDNQLYQILGDSEMIQDIVKTDQGYAILTKNVYIRATIHYSPEVKIGPVAFTFSFEKPIPLNCAE